MRVIVILRPAPGRTLVEMRPLIAEQEGRIRAAYQAGRIRYFAFQPEPLRIVLFFEAPDRIDVACELATWPMPARGLLDIELIEAGVWRPP